MEVWMSPCTGGKRARSPVERLADLQQGNQGDDDEANWRSSKRYFTEVIANGFSKLTFSRGMQPRCQNAVPRPMQHQQDGSPSSYRLQLPAGLLSPREDSDCEMDMQESPTWPPQRSSPCSNGNRPPRGPSSTGTFNGLASPPGANTVSAGQFPFGGYNAPASKATQHAGALSAPQPTAGSPVLPPKVLKAVEKAPNSPSDMPAVVGNLRKVALLRALLVRTEHHLQPQQPPEQQADTTDIVQCQQQQQQQPQQGQQCSLNPVMPQHQQHTQPHDCDAEGVCFSRGMLQDNLRPGRPCSAGEQPSASSRDCDDMECSSSSDSPNSTPCSATMPIQAGLEDLAAGSLLCTEVLAGNSQYIRNDQQQQQQQQTTVIEADQQPSSGEQQPPLWASLVQGHALQVHNQHQGASMQRPQSQQQQWPQQQQHPPPQHPSQMLPPRPKLKSPELSKDRLEALRAKAIASTCKLTNLESEDLHSLQRSLNASQCRRGSDHVHMNSTLAPAASIRRHSSHI